ncbi:MAG: PASTA domain-containing protein [Bacteroidetes bacterium]|nr:PASTA domain-containing protein [Bacteroidota bacterium]
MNIKKDILWRVILSIVVLAVFGVGLVISIVRIQFVQGDKWRQMSDSLYLKLRKVPAIRGSIYSEDGNLLATSVPIYKISLDFEVIQQYHKDSFQRYRPQLAQLLSNNLKNASAGRYDTLLIDGYKHHRRYLTISHNASFIQAQKLLNWPIFRAGRYKGGVILEERTIRRKPYGDLMARTIGYINENNRGAGIEASFTNDLSGVDGQMIVRRISGGYRPEENEIQIRPENGKDIFTTIDVHLQDIVSEALTEGLETHRAEFGTAILLEVKSGKIKAIANLNETAEGYRERFNHALGTGYEPGSTIKLVSAMATLDKGKVHIDDSVFIDGGEYKFTSKDIFKDSERGQPDYLTYREVFEKSSNVGIIKTTYSSYRDAPREFIEYFDKLHLTEPIGTGIRGEVKPTIIRPDQSAWAGTTLPSLSIGYSVKTSPMHMAMLYNAVANNGVMMKPYLISSVGYLGKAEQTFEPVVLNEKICKSETLELLKDLLEGVVEEGTAKNLRDLPFKVAGKTGTSKISGGASGYQEGQYYSSFVGYFPSDAPQYTLMVLVGKPSSGQYYGASVAVPVFKNVARKVQANSLHIFPPKSDSTFLPALISGRWKDVRKTLKHLSLEYERPDAEINNLVSGSPEHDQVILNARSLPQNSMPDFEGFALRHALTELENKGYKVRFTGFGKIVEQSPLPGSPLTKGQVIYLRLSPR